jgi:hypothetical protein
MPRVENLSAITSIALLIAGVLLPHFAPNSGWSMTWRGTGYGFSYQMPCYGIASLFGVFAFLYSIGYVPFDKAVAQWHFWGKPFALAELSAVAPFWKSIGNQSLLSQVAWISCRGWWRCRTACGFPWRKPHTRSCLVLRNRKFRYAGANLGHPALRLGADYVATILAKGGIHDSVR